MRVFFLTIISFSFQSALGFPVDPTGLDIRNPEGFEQTGLSSQEGENGGRSDKVSDDSEKKNLMEAFFNEDNKKWNLGWTSTYSRGVHWLAKSRWSNDLGFSYKLSKVSLSARGAYVYPLSPVTGTSFYGLTDISLSGSGSLKDRIGLNTTGGLGISLPTSERARKQKKYFSLYGFLSYKYSRPQFPKLLGPLRLNHVFYWGWYGSRSDKSGFLPNPLLSTSHSASVALAYKNIRFSGTIRLYLYVYSADTNKDPSVKQTEFKLKGSQGASFQAAYNIKKRWNIYGHAALNIPIVSPVLTGNFPLTHNRNWQWSLGFVFNL